MMEDFEPLVFVVDDDASVRKALARLIGSVGISVETFASADEFLAREPHEGAACVLLDVRMPGLSGLQLQQHLAESGRSLAVIFMTGYGTIPMTVQAMKAGAVDFLEKPFEDQDLIDAVYKALEENRDTIQAEDELRAIKERLDSLTSRQREVFEMVVSGKLNKQIASELGTSEKTVKAQRAQVMKKMHAGSLADLVRSAEKMGIRNTAV
jgi:RNA polymerase sigma factor (sigma-70 family)